MSGVECYFEMDSVVAEHKASSSGPEVVDFSHKIFVCIEFHSIYEPSS